ncbi:C-type lectin domain family 4 member F-like isoform X1 [Pimephales promelas]|uniref:C-type lectin domain family 4 member F-like isoform X1 n=1 Tax=Pimephales promelas TaxID=90988 RepID=UPI0019555CBB|nr:C-type lectin domain family 4 member F-like isoform X1 [Pimephales promelas]
MMLKNTEQTVLISHSADLFLQNNLLQVNILWKEERKVLWKQVAAVMMVYQKTNSSEEIMKMDMENERKTFSKGRSCSRKTGIFVLLGTVCMIIFLIMTSVIFFHQQRTFSVLESWMNLHSSNQTSVKPQEKNIETLMTNLASSLSSITSKQAENQQKLERQQDLSHTEVKSLMNSLNSAVSALTSKLNDTASLSSSMSVLKSSVSDFTSSVASLSSQLSVLRQQDMKSLNDSLNSAVSVLTSKLNDAVKTQDQKQTETERSLDSLKSSIQSDQQSKQRDFASLSSSMSVLKSSVSDLSSSVASLSSQLSVLRQQDMKSLTDSLNSAVSVLTSKLNDAVKTQDQKQTETERSLDSLKSSILSDQQSKQRDFASLSSSLSVLKSSVSDLSSSVASLSSKQQISEERVMNALKDLKSNMENKTADVPVTCKSGWISHKSSCFLFSNNELSWTGARDNCKSQGASLLKIEEDDEEWTFLNKHTMPLPYWVGLTDQNTGQWRWADDTPYTMNIERWNPGQPDDYKGHNLGVGEEGEDCGQFMYTGKLNDNHCSTKMRFICRV